MEKGCVLDYLMILTLFGILCKDKESYDKFIISLTIDIFRYCYSLVALRWHLAIRLTNDWHSVTQ